MDASECHAILHNLDEYFDMVLHIKISTELLNTEVNIGVKWSLGFVDFAMISALTTIKYLSKPSPTLQSIYFMFDG